jgi:hypothetical protein
MAPRKAEIDPFGPPYSFRRLVIYTLQKLFRSMQQSSAYFRRDLQGLHLLSGLAKGHYSALSYRLLLPSDGTFFILHYASYKMSIVGVLCHLVEWKGTADIAPPCLDIHGLCFFFSMRTSHRAHTNHYLTYDWEALLPFMAPTLKWNWLVSRRPVSIRYNDGGLLK